MSGLLGGILELINVIGGLVLMLLIGMAAWRKTGRARWARIAFGGIFFGFALGWLLSLVAFTYIGDTPKPSSDLVGFIYTGAFFGLPILILVISIFLEILKRHIEEDSDT